MCEWQREEEEQRETAPESARPDVCSVLYVANGHAKQHRRKTQNGTAKNVQRKAKTQIERAPLSHYTVPLPLSLCYLLFFSLLLRGPHLQGSAVADFYRFDCSLWSLRRDAADFALAVAVAVAGRRQLAAVAF